MVELTTTPLCEGNIIELRKSFALSGLKMLLHHIPRALLWAILFQPLGLSQLRKPSTP